MAQNRREFLKMGAGGLALAAAGCMTGTGGEVQDVRAAPKSVQDAKRAALARLPELGPTITDFEVRRKKNIPGKRAAFYIDDVVFLFQDMAEKKPKSLWYHPFFAHLKECWEKYGLKSQLNVFYKNCFFYGVQNAQFTLKDMPDTWRDEFQGAKEWLRFGFHSYEEYPDYPLINASYDEIKWLWDNLSGEVARFAGPGMWAKAVTPHWGPLSKEGCIALKDCGAKVIWTSRGRRWAYNGDRNLLPYGHGYRIECRRKPETAIYWRTGGGDDIAVSACGYNHLMDAEVEKTRGTYNWIHDRATGCNFKAFSFGGPCLNLFKLKDIVPKFEQVTAKGEPEFFIHATHEEYFFRHYFMYQPDYCEKTKIAAKWMHDHGYSYAFIEDSVD